MVTQKEYKQQLIGIILMFVALIIFLPIIGLIMCVQEIIKFSKDIIVWEVIET